MSHEKTILNESTTKYNYVFFNTFGECLKPVFGPLEGYSEVRLYDYAFKANVLVQKIFFLHWSTKINRIVDLPLKKIWYRKMFKQQFSNSKPCCYVFLGGKYVTDDSRVYEYIKQLNPENKCIVLCYDLISKKYWNVDEVKKISDKIITYDRGEAKKYNIDFFEMDIYGAITEVTTPEKFDVDVYFLGFAKDRLPKIHGIYQYLSQQNVKCKFIICDAKKEEQISGEGIYYSSPISYEENIENIRNSRCILEIIQGGSASATLRTQESQVYKRKLLTNNGALCQQDFYNPINICVYELIEQIDIPFVKSPIDYAAFNESNRFAPYKLIEYMEKLFE